MELKLNISDDVGNYIEEVARANNTSTTKVVEDVLHNNRLLELFGSAQNFDQFIQQGLSSSIKRIENIDSYFQNLEK